MCVVLVRSLILYIAVIFAVRLMGKRQLGELQPSELVITILVSNIATLPIEDVSIPLSVGLTPILSLVCFEVLTSWLSLRFPKLNRLISGSPKIIISGGKIDTEVMTELRFSVDDLMTALRGQGVFDISEVQFAIVETTGSISVMKKQSDDMPVRRDIGISTSDEDPPQLIAADGRLLLPAIKSLGMNTEAVRKIISGTGMSVGEVMIMTADSSGKCYIAGKNGAVPYIINGGIL
ncbi:MAG: DUF421 domain-containing protein [Ruminococcus sp.]|nr:DUF421 domain-containing protein [Ruminococcus sp.]